MPRPALLCISQSFAPATTPTAIRAGALLARLSEQWDVTVITEAVQEPGTEAQRAAAGSGEPGPPTPLRVEVVASRRPARLLAAVRRLRLSKLLDLLVWPDESIFWVLPAIRAARRVARERRPSAIVVFMMPYSAGLVGLALRRLTKLPLILNLDDSLTCTDMHPDFPSALHYRLARGLEDRYARTADATVYVSATNLEAVRARAPEPVRERIELVRYGADPARFGEPGADAEVGSDSEADSGSEVGGGLAAGDRFEVAYVGAMSGWWALIEQQSPPPGLAKRAYEGWNGLGRHELIALDPRTSSPAYLGRAMLGAIARHPDWRGWLELVLYGNPYPPEVVERALAAAGVQELVTVHGPAPHEQMPGVLARADLLFITLPKRLDGSRGGRISAKTYEYLMTDRPILAAVPRGENWDYLADKPGVWLVEPDDERGMESVLLELGQAKAAGAPRIFDRAALREQLSYDTRARELAAVIERGIARHAGARPVGSRT